MVYLEWHGESAVSSSVLQCVPSQISLHASQTARSPRRVIVLHEPGSPLLDVFQGVYVRLGGDPAQLRHTPGLDR